MTAGINREPALHECLASDSAIQLDQIVRSSTLTKARHGNETIYKITSTSDVQTNWDVASRIFVHELINV